MPRNMCMYAVRRWSLAIVFSSQLVFAFMYNDNVHSSENSSNKEETYLVERLFSSSLVAVVTQAQKRKLKLCHFKVNIVL